MSDPMGHSTDDVKLELRESQLVHVSAMKTMRDVVERIVGNNDESTTAKADFLTGGLNRRRFLRVGGMTIATAAVFAACGSDDDGATSTAPDDDGENTDGNGTAAQDISILRTASSIEALAVDVYQRALDSGLLTTAAVREAVELFQKHHREHGGLFQGATKEAGGEPFTTANPVVLRQVQPAIAALTNEVGVVRLAYDLETAATATYFSAVGMFEDADLNRATMSVGGVEARHAAVLAGILGQAEVPRAFQTADSAVPGGTGV